MMTKIDIRDADWAKTIVMFYLLMFVLLLCSGCATRSQSEDLRVPGEQFQVIAYELSTIAADRASAPTFMVIRHKISGRCFLFASSPSGGGSLLEVTGRTTLIDSTFVLTGERHAQTIEIEGQDMCHSVSIEHGTK